MMLLISIALGAGIGYFAYLHSPRPQARTSVVINRNSLLPHRYAGACMNCHRIEELGPVSMNQQNMHLFRLSGRERRLVEAGQRVEAPGAALQLQTPAITRSDSLPHSFVGVCSNCHLVLDLQPSVAFMQESMRRAYQPLHGAPSLTRIGADGQHLIARGGVPHAPRDLELYRNVTGYVALFLFLFGCVYVVMRQLVRLRPETYRGRFDLRSWLHAHEWLSVCFTVVGCLHWYFSERGNNFLHVGLLAMIWLTAAGLLLHYRVASKQIGKSVRLLHSQRAVFVAMVILLLLGHWFVPID